MFKQSPSRNQRSKGFKIKHALQIGLLLAVCIWLLYQVKHSHDKKKAFEESNAKLLEKMESGHEIIKLGRKDLHPRVEESISENEGHNEEEEIEEQEENKHDEEEDENKHEEVEDEGEESKPEENEDEGRGGGDDEVDEHDRERAEEEAKREEGFVDEEDKESEEKENEEKEDQIEDQDHDRNTQEAREEQYKGDDASSAVVRDTQGMNTETESGVGEKSNEEEHVEKLEPDELGSQNKTSSIEEVTSDQHDNLKTGDGEIIEGNQTLNATNGEVNGSGITLSEAENGSQTNSTTNLKSIDQPEVNNNSTAENGEIPSSSMQNGTDITQDQTIVMIPSNVGDSNLQAVVPEQTENSNMNSEMVESDSNSLLSTTTQNADESNGESGEEQTVKSGEEDGSVSSVTNENIDGDQKDESETTAGTEEAEDNSSSSTTNDNEDSVESKSVDSNDTLIPEVREARTDLSTLPETVTEGTNSEDAAEK
ncbi:hypothetical protein BVC80_1063g4 [Macleaya cordata]|uniref:Uncharacterized protein n=1 Tax=Macleaya cordata TaxID=56857 RepID=A0A200RCL8_MACCD|nr:hypothetical protein BVC80_1063g4 [Macleaya cordata]